MIARALAYPHIFPVVIMCLYGLAIVRYAFARDYGRCVYWACAMGITFSATFMVGSK